MLADQMLQQPHALGAKLGADEDLVELCLRFHVHSSWVALRYAFRLERGKIARLRRKAYRRLTGLPGKSPVSRLVTMYCPSFCSTAKGTLVYEYLADDAVFQDL